jgi:nucleotide-binding universal stress UspA family protein
MRKVLIATDFSSHADRALVHALELVKLTGGEVEVFTSAYLPPQALAAMAMGMVPGLVDDARREAVQRIDTLAGHLRASHRSVTSASSTEEPSMAIVARAAEIGADLVAMGTRGHTGLAHVMFGSVAERVARLAPCAVLTAHADSPTPAPYRCVLVPTDFSPDSDAAIAFAREVVTRSGGKLVLLHAYDLPSLVLTGSALAAAHLEKTLADSARDKLAELRASLRDLTVESYVSAARPDPAIFEAADRVHADLIVMGTRGRSGLSHVLLGSTAERVIRRAHVPVVTVKGPRPA